MVWGWAKWIGVAPPSTAAVSKEGSRVLAMEDRQARRQRRRIWWTMHAVSILAAGVWAAGGLGIVARGGLSEGWIGQLYDNMYAKIWL